MSDNPSSKNALAESERPLDEHAAAESRAAAPSPRDERSQPNAFRSRFAMINIALALVAGAAIGALVVLGLKEDSTAPRNGLVETWGAFVPRGPADARAEQIAARVGSKYRLPNGTQLVGVIPGPPTVTSNQPEGSVQILVRAIATRPNVPTGGSTTSPKLDTTDPSNSLQFLMCGYGQSCSIATGAPSDERALLLRREALELSLYTFKYMPNIDSIVVFLPPPVVNGQQVAGGQAVYLQRDDVSGFVSRPLRDTLDPRTPTLGSMSARDTTIVNEITAPQRFSYDYTSAQDGGAVLLLSPITANP